MSFSVTDLERLGETALQEFSAAHGSASEQDEQVSSLRLEAKLEQLYAIAATLAQREDRLEEVAAIWARMVAVCDSMAKVLASSSNKTIANSYDRILDIRNVCEENRALHA